MRNLLIGVDELRQAFKRSAPSLTAQQANALGKEYLQRIREADISLDKVTDHGRREGVTLKPSVSAAEGDKIF